MMTRRDAILTGAGLAAGLMLPSSPAAARGRSRALGGGFSLDEGTFFPWTRVGEGVHAVIDFQTGGNVLLVSGTGESVLVDTKFPGIANALLREAGGKGAELRYVVNTHHHGDHTGGNVAFRSAGVGVVAHKNTEARIAASWQTYAGGVTGGPRFVGQFDDRPTSGQVLDEAGELLNGFGDLSVADWTPDDVMAGNERTLAFGGREAELTHFGQAAHTDNDVVVHLKDANVLHTGDLVFAGLHPYFDPTAGVNARGWIEVLNKVRALCDKDTVVIPGHGEIGNAETIDNQRVYLEKLIEAVQKDIEAGVPKDETAAKTFDFMEGLGFVQIRERAINAVHDELTAG